MNPERIKLLADIDLGHRPQRFAMHEYADILANPDRRVPMNLWEINDHTRLTLPQMAGLLEGYR